MEKTVSIDYLKNHPRFIPVIAAWIFNKWGHLDPSDTLAAAGKRVAQRLNESTLPITLIALRDVEERMRNLGIGGMVVRGVEEMARKLGIPKLHLITPDKCSFYERQGWSFLEETEYLGHQQTIMTKEFST